MNATVWDTLFSQRGHIFREPHEGMGAFVECLTYPATKRVLDLGCGTGRHVVALARRGFAVTGLDSSPTALELTRAWLDAESLSATLTHHDMTDPLPYPDGHFAAVISVQVIHHGTLATTQRVVGEVTRVLAPGGLVFVSVPTLRNQAKHFAEIEPNTLVPLDGPEQGLPHHYFDQEALEHLFNAFRLHKVQLDSRMHLCLTAEKP